jgi:hypothetical protein
MHCFHSMILHQEKYWAASTATAAMRCWTEVVCQWQPVAKMPSSVCHAAEMSGLRAGSEGRNLEYRNLLEAGFVLLTSLSESLLLLNYC